MKHTSKKEILKFPVNLKIEIDENGKGILSGKLNPKDSLKVWDFIIGSKNKSYIVIEKNVITLVSPYSQENVK